MTPTARSCGPGRRAAIGASRARQAGGTARSMLDSVRYVRTPEGAGTYVPPRHAGTSPPSWPDIAVDDNQRARSDPPDCLATQRTRTTRNLTETDWPLPIWTAATALRGGEPPARAPAQGPEAARGRLWTSKWVQVRGRVSGHPRALTVRGDNRRVSSSR